ncbi:MAG: DUF58 domain-containing protein [Defluviitaleaceae bacterium]|nr:DUF58 domain-containing protein [Defluviitaleaceae bacterium]
MLKNRLTYGVVLTVLILLIFLYEDGITYMALYTALALPILSFALTALSRRRFSVEERLTQDNIIKGETVQYVFNVTNHSFLPYTSVRVRFKANSSAVTADFADKFFSIGPYKNHEIIFNISAKYRGNYEIGVLNITVFDFLGLFRFEQKHDRAFMLTVRPRVLDLTELPLSKTESGAENVKNFMAEEDYAIISDLRKYQPSDGYKKIHWKASAKKNELVSKNYQNTKRNSVVLLLDNSMPIGDKKDEMVAMAMEDLIMEAYVSTLSYGTRHMYACSLYYMGDEQNEGASGNFDYLYAIAAKIDFVPRGAFGAYLSAYSKMQANADNILIFAQEITDTLFATVQTLSHFGSIVSVFYFKDLNEEEFKRVARLADMGIDAIDFRKIFA